MADKSVTTNLDQDIELVKAAISYAEDYCESALVYAARPALERIIKKAKENDDQQTTKDDDLRKLAKDLIRSINDGDCACTSEGGGVWDGKETEDLFICFFRKVTT